MTAELLETNAAPVTDTRPTWHRVFADGFAPGMSDAALQALADGLRRDDPALLQGATTSPPPMACVTDWLCEAADIIGFAFWRGDGLKTVGKVEEAFARACHDCDQRLNCPAACRWFLNAYDDTPRFTMFPALLAVVESVLSERRAEADRKAEADFDRYQELLAAKELPLCSAETDLL